MRTVLLGPPGAGKGTQAKRLAEKYSMEHLSSGDIFRAEKASGSELGEQIAKRIDHGKFVPDPIVVEMMTRAIVEAGESFLLDGFPRTLAQARSLDESLATRSATLDLVILIEVADDEVVERIAGRRIAPESGCVYHVTFNPPKVEGVCDESGEALVHRADDCEEIIRQRLKTYHEQTQPVIDYYRNCEGLDMFSVTGTNKMPDDVTESIFAAMQQRI
ncbi:MAG: adenylate kinase [Phycisphaerales bacterium]|jgi:adenylate kinase|nr:adenylate kinase [Phycisphaerales bacterium]MBT7171588.1 adenylate kinase [Phycisphaerales bacterium]